MASDSSKKDFYLAKLSKAVAFLLPEPGNIQATLALISRGAVWAFGITFVFSALLTSVLLITSQVSTFDQAIRFSVALIFGSTGAPIQLGLPAFDSPLGQITSSAVGLHAGTVALVVIFLSRRFGRRLTTRSEGTVYPSRTFSVYLGVGFAAFELLLSLLSRGVATVANQSFNLEPLSWQGAFLIFGLVFASSLSGFSLGRSRRTGESSAWAFSASFLGYFTWIYSTLIVIASAIWFIRTLIEPTFENAVAPTKLDISASGDQILLAATGLVLFLPNLLVVLFGLATGASVSLDATGASVNQISTLLAAFNIDVPFNKAQSVFTLAGWPAYLAVTFLVATVSLVAGAAAARRTSFAPSGLQHLLGSIIAATTFAIAATYFSGAQAFWTVTTDKTTEDNSLVTGITPISAVVVASIVGALAFWASGKGKNFANSAFSPILNKISTPHRTATTSVPGRVFGVAAVLAIALAGLTPIVASTTNRVWASTADGPVQISADAINKLENAKMKDLQKFLNPENLSTYAWLSDEILQAARPSEGTKSTISAKNLLGKQWQVGNMDADISIEFDKGSGTESVLWTFGTKSKLTDPLWLIKHPKFHALLKPEVVSISTSSFLSNVKTLNLKVNGKAALPGTYFGIPGSYQVTANGYKLVAPTDESFASNKGEVKITFGTGAQLPAGGNELMIAKTNAIANGCLTISSKGDTKCYSTAQVRKAVEVTSGTVPKKFFDSDEKEFKALNLKCTTDKRKDKLTSATSVVGTTDCTVEITYKEIYYSSKTIKGTCSGQMVNNFDNGPVYYNSSWGRYEDGYFWYRDDQVHYVACYKKLTPTRKVRDAKLAEVTKSGTLKFQISVVGILDDKDKFTVKK